MRVIVTPVLPIAGARDDLKGERAVHSPHHAIEIGLAVRDAVINLMPLEIDPTKCLFKLEFKND